MTTAPCAERRASDLALLDASSPAQDATWARLQAASEACRAEPNRPELHYIYGQEWLAAGNPARAEQAFGMAIRLNPNWPDAWVNFGLARYKQGAVGDAKTAMGKALQAQPWHAAATSNLAALLRITGGYDAAQTILRQALARNPADPGARLNLAADYLQEERPADALALLDAVPPPKSLAPARHWHLQRALALVELGRLGPARAAMAALDALGPVPPALAPLRQWRLTLLALAQGDRDGARAHAMTMEQMIEAMGPDAVPEHRIMARYDLAKFWSMLGEHSRAFAQWSAGHDLLKPIQPFSRDAHRTSNDAAMASFTQARLQPGPRAENDDSAPVFIVGMPRSGTTLCEQIIAAHPHAHGGGERSALGNLAWRLGGGDDPAAIARIAGLPQSTLDEAAAAYLAELHALAPGGARIVDKMPGNYRYVWLIALLFPSARIIHCMRDPRDIGLSIFTFRFHGDHGYAHDLADLGWMIAEQDRVMAHWKSLLPSLGMPILTVKLADWVHDFDATLVRVLGHCGLPPDPACARFYERDSEVRTVSRSQVRQPVNARGLGRWIAYAAELAPLIAELDAAGCLAAWPPAAAHRS